MISNQQQTTSNLLGSKSGERGAALVMAIIMMGLLAGISLCALAVVSNEARISGSDLQRTQTFYAAAAGIEKMTSDFSALFLRTSNPTPAQLKAISDAFPTELVNEGFVATQDLSPDIATLTSMRQSLGITNGSYPTVTIPSGPFAGLLATVSPYKLTSTVNNTSTKAEVMLQREMNNYLIPLFQFGMFSDKDIELHPGPPFVFNGRIHTNGNLYLNGDVTMRDKVTVANELVYDRLRNNSARTGASVSMVVGAIDVPLTMGSVVNGPNLPGAVKGGRGFFPTSPNGTDNTSWKNTSVAAAQSTKSNQFGGQLLTRTTGAVPLLLPLQLGGNPPRELIKRSMTGEALLDPILNQSRYQTKSEIRILIDDENNTGDAAAIPTGQGVLLSTFNPMALDGGSALRVINSDSNSNGTYATTLGWLQGDPTRLKPADTVRGIRSDYSITAASLNATAAEAANASNAAVPKGPGGGFIPPGAGVKGRILIQIIAPDGTARDVTKEILSMGMTEGEPNGIVYLQRPLWAAYVQGSRDRDGGNENLEFLTTDSTSRCIADGEINTTNFSIDANASYYNTAANNVDDDAHTAAAPYMPTALTRNDKPSGMNAIVPINVYNPREGWINNTLDERKVFERGMTSVIEINMRNLARWVDGVYDNTLLKGTTAVSGNIDGNSYNGYVVYVSDRRGDRVKTEVDRANNPIQATNGMVDNEDIYGPNNSLDPGEDVQEKGLLKDDTTEMPDPVDWALGPVATTAAQKRARTDNVESFPDLSWSSTRPDGSANTHNYFRRAVRLFNGDDLQISTGTGKLSTTKGLTISTENMLYIWGSYNTTGISTAPPAGAASLNDGTYLGNQVPASIVADAIFPLSRTWCDSMSAYNPEGGNSGSTMRTADVNVSGPTQETSVRAAIISGTNMSALSGTPDAGNGADSRLSGGMHNFPRFLENWLTPQRRWNYVGSICPLYYSTQALGPWTYINNEIYGAPSRNWAFDTTFRDPNRLPPGTPMFQYIESTGFRQVLQ